MIGKEEDRVKMLDEVVRRRYIKDFGEVKWRTVTVGSKDTMIGEMSFTLPEKTFPEDDEEVDKIMHQLQSLGGMMFTDSLFCRISTAILDELVSQVSNGIGIENLVDNLVEEFRRGE